MPGRLKLEFAPLGAPAKGVLVLFCEDGVKFGSGARRALAPTGDLVRRAAAGGRVKGKKAPTPDPLAPPRRGPSRLFIVGGGQAPAPNGPEFVKHRGARVGENP